MEAIKTSQNVEFDVIYADGTREHVAEGVLFGIKDNGLIFYNGTDRLEAFAAVVEAAAEVAGAVGYSEAERALILYKAHKRLFEIKGEQNHGI